MPWSHLAHILGLEKGGAVRTALADLWAQVAGGGSGARGVGFTIAVVSLCAKMAKADGVAVQVEADAFERHFAVPHDEMDNVRRLFDLAKQDVSGFESYAEQIAERLAAEPALLTDVLECLFHIAAADGIMHAAEEAFLQVVADKFGVAPEAYRRLRALFVRDPTSPYEVIGALPSDSDATLKARYRALVLEHHPDRLIGRGVPEAFARLAEAKLATINAAWEDIARERGL
jgi:DnaJ like chaperone protein